ncbi:MAG: 4-hydroxy-3-methylbut-2-enyl diphosphate reductase [Bacteroidales bacterium]|nr:4-hydroxy-3-methylbut-2-enyl diphosphate reductase [Bacteroidales bacterium]
MITNIDINAGFCFGVTNAIKKAEAEISEKGILLCLGEMVHNQEETKRLSDLGLKTISYQEFNKITNSTVLFRAHGEPPKTYQIAEKNNINIIDATCPIVLRLHKIIHENALKYPNAQTIIFGKKDHAEVVGLVGQVEKAKVISSEDEIDKIDYSTDLLLYSQTTMNSSTYDSISQSISNKLSQKNPTAKLLKFDTVCRSVAARVNNLEEYVKKYDSVLFVAGANSSNGKYLFSACQKANPRTYYIANKNDFTPEMFQNVETLGITGATSTPKWLLQDIEQNAIVFAEKINVKKLN